MKIPFLAPATAILLLATAYASGSPQAARQRLEEAVQRVVSLAMQASSTAQLARDVRPVLEEYMAFDKMTQRAVGPAWRAFSEAEKREATELFTRLLIHSYCDKYTLGENPRVEYRTPVELQPGRVEVPTRTLYRGSRYEVIYRLELLGNWKVTDVVVEGVSFVANYRSQFHAHHQRGGHQAVLASLRQSAHAL